MNFDVLYPKMNYLNVKKQIRTFATNFKFLKYNFARMNMNLNAMKFYLTIILKSFKY